MYKNYGKNDSLKKGKGKVAAKRKPAVKRTVGASIKKR